MTWCGCETAIGVVMQLSIAAASGLVIYMAKSDGTAKPW